MTTEAAFFLKNLTFSVRVSSDEFKGHSLLQAAREADMAKAKKTLALEIINFKHPHTHETALVRFGCILKLWLLYWCRRVEMTCPCVLYVRLLALCSSVASPQKEAGDRAAAEERCQRQREE